jgi:hypothetical protein
MNVLYFSPHFPPNYVWFISELKKAGANTLGIADVPYEQLSPVLKASLDDYYRVNNLEDYEEVVQAIGYFIHQYGRINHLDSLNEHWLMMEANLRTDFNIPGLKNDVIEDMKFKSRMKQRFIKAGVPVARGKVISTLDEARRFIRTVKYPVIAKPDNGVGATATFKISDNSQLEAFFNNQPDTPYIFEEFIHGTIESFDGLTDKNGQLIFYTSNVFCQGIMDIVNHDKHVYYYTQKKIPKDITEAGKKILHEFDLKGRFFHFEFFRKEDGGLVALEVNMRPPGGFTTDLFNYASNINIYEKWAKVVTGQDATFDYTRKYHACYIGRKNRFEYVNDLSQVVKHCGNDLVFHSPVPDVLSPALGHYGFIIRHENLGTVKKYIDFILNAQ